MKKLLSIVLAAAMLLSLASIASAEATKITVWATDGAETVVYTQMFEDFNAKHTDVQVDFQPFPQDELLNKLSTSDVVGDTPEVIIIDGSQLTSTATSQVTDKTYDGVTITFSDGAKYQSSTGENKFADKAILIGKKGKYIYNKTAIPGRITKFEVYANKGASASVTVGINFSDSPIAEYDASASNTFTATLSTLDSVYDCTEMLSSNAKYFWYQVTNANNSQIQFRITYE